MWSESFEQNVDGVGLDGASLVHQAHHWISKPATLLRPEDFVKHIKVRINAELPVIDQRKSDVAR